MKLENSYSATLLLVYIMSLSSCKFLSKDIRPEVARVSAQAGGAGESSSNPAVASLSPLSCEAHFPGDFLANQSHGRWFKVDTVVVAFSCAHSGQVAISSLECRLNDEDFQDCSLWKGRHIYPSLPEGEYAFEVRASSADSEVSTAHLQWFLDRTPPALSPGQGHNKYLETFVGNSARFHIQAEDFPAAPLGSGVSRIYCRVRDAQGQTSPNYQDCSNGQWEKTSLLPNADHIFEAYAVDVAGNQSLSPVQESFHSPENPVSGIEGCLIQKNIASVTGATSASLSYQCSSPRQNLLRTLCRLDSAPFATCPASSIPYNNLSEGLHRFQIRLEEDDGTLVSANETTWIIDRTAPRLTWAPAPFVPGQYAEFPFDVSENYSFPVTVQCRLYKNNQLLQEQSSCSSPFIAGANLESGVPYRFSAVATDGLGNASSPLEHSWMPVHDGSPVCVILNTSSEFSNASESEIHFRCFSAKEISEHLCRVNGQSWQNCSDVDMHTVSTPNSGNYFIEVMAKDVEGISSTQASGYVLKVDRNIPTAQFSVANALNPQARISLNVSDSGGSGLRSVRCRVDGDFLNTSFDYQKQWTVCPAQGDWILNGLVENESYTVFVEVEDKAHNLRAVSSSFVSLLPPSGPTCQVASGVPVGVTNLAVTQLGLECDAQNVQLACSFNGQDWAACSQVVSVDNPMTGQKHFYVRGAALANPNTWGPTDHISYSVDRTAPELIVGDPSFPSNNLDYAVLSFSVSDSGPATLASVECDYRIWNEHMALLSERTAFSCSSPLQVPQGAVAGNRVEVVIRARDSAGNSASVQRVWHNEPVIVCTPGIVSTARYTWNATTSTCVSTSSSSSSSSTDDLEYAKEYCGLSVVNPGSVSLHAVMSRDGSALFDLYDENNATALLDWNCDGPNSSLNATLNAECGFATINTPSLSLHDVLLKNGSVYDLYDANNATSRLKWSCTGNSSLQTALNSQCGLKIENPGSASVHAVRLKNSTLYDIFDANNATAIMAWECDANSSSSSSNSSSSNSTSSSSSSQPPVVHTCSNGMVNYPSCNQCPAGKTNKCGRCVTQSCENDNGGSVSVGAHKTWTKEYSMGSWDHTEYGGISGSCSASRIYDGGICKTDKVRVTCKNTSSSTKTMKFQLRRCRL